MLFFIASFTLYLAQQQQHKPLRTSTVRASHTQSLGTVYTVIRKSPTILYLKLLSGTQSFEVAL